MLPCSACYVNFNVYHIITVHRYGLLSTRSGTRVVCPVMMLGAASLNLLSATAFESIFKALAGRFDSIAGLAGRDLTQ